MFNNFIFNFIRNLILNLLYLLRLKRSIEFEPKKKLDSMYLISVNYNIKKLKGCLKIGLSKESSIIDAKHMIVNKLNKLILAKLNDESELIKSNQIAIIFAGQELDDQTTIANYDISQNSIINVVRITEKLIASKQADLFQSAYLLSTNSELNDIVIDLKEEAKEDDFGLFN